MTTGALFWTLMGCRPGIPEVPSGTSCPASAEPSSEGRALLDDALSVGPWTLSAQFDSFPVVPPVELGTWSVDIVSDPTFRQIHRVIDETCVEEEVAVAQIHVTGGDGRVVLENGWVEVRRVESVGLGVRGYATSSLQRTDDIELWWREAATVLGQPPGQISPVKELFFSKENARLHMANGFQWFDSVVVAEGSASLDIPTE